MNNSELDGRKIQVMMAQPEKKYNRDSSKSKGQRSNYQNHAPFRGYRVRIQNLPHNITWRFVSILHNYDNDNKRIL